MLDNKDKKNPFSVPENYFQNFNTEIMNMLPEKEEVVRKKTIPLWKSVNKWIAAAAVVTGMAFVGIQYMDNNTGSKPDNNSTGTISSNENVSSLENDYYLFLEEEATRLAYKDAFYDDDF